MGAVEELLAQFIVETRPDQIPEPALSAVRRSIYDCVGCMLAASAEPSTAAIVRFASAEDRSGRCAIVGTTARTGPSAAALANGTLAHWLDFDDGRVAAGHLASVVTPALLALGEPARVSGISLLAAYAVGLEAVTHISDACVYEEKQGGVHKTALFGVLAATAAGARLVGLSPRQTVTALGIAGSTPSGVVQNFGTQTKPLHAGLAARSAVSAVLLAGDGWTSTPDILGGALGWSAAYTSQFHYEQMGFALGSRWLTAEDTPLIKAYPCCGASHRSIDALLSLMAEHRFAVDDVELVQVPVAGDSLAIMYDWPRNGMEAKFSLRYTMAAALCDGDVCVQSFEQDRISRPQVLEAAQRIQLVLDSRWGRPAANAQSNGPAGREPSGPLIVRLRDGRSYQRVAGRIPNLRTDEQIAEKFRANASRRLTPERAESALQIWMRLGAQADVGAALESVTVGRAEL